jgi:hypothetical protein
MQTLALVAALVQQVALLALFPKNNLRKKVIGSGFPSR